MEKGEKMGEINLDWHECARGPLARMLPKGVDGSTVTGKELQEKKFRGKEITYTDVVA